MFREVFTNILHSARLKARQLGLFGLCLNLAAQPFPDMESVVVCPQHMKGMRDVGTNERVRNLAEHHFYDYAESQKVNCPCCRQTCVFCIYNRNQPDPEEEETTTTSTSKPEQPSRSSKKKIVNKSVQKTNDLWERHYWNGQCGNCKPESFFVCPNCKPEGKFDNR